jgi:dienelactone hydrolase
MLPIETDSQACRRQFLKSATAGLVATMAAGAVCAEGQPQVLTIDEQIRRSAEQAPLAMEFRGQTMAECRIWQKAFSDKLRSLLGPHDPPPNWKTEVERRVELPDHWREELMLTAANHPPLPVYLLIPRQKIDKPRPAVLAIHGHSGGNFGYDVVAEKDDQPGAAAEIKQVNYDYGRQLVRRGFVVAAPCLTPFGRRLGDKASYGKQDPCAITFIRLQLLGKVLMAENLRDCLWAFNLLAGHPQVDPKRLACVGLSYGGRMAMLTTSLEPRIRLGVVSGALNVMQERIGGRYSCGAQVIPGLLQYADVPEIGALIAPRPCVWEVGSRDGLLPPQWAAKALERMRRAYGAFDAKDQLCVDRFEGGHQWSGRLAYPLMAKVLG